MDGAEALGHLCKWLGEEASLQLVVLTGLEQVLAEEQVFQVEDLVLLRDEGMLETVFTKYVTRRKVEIALDRHKLQVSGQGAGEQWASSGWAAGEQARSPAAGVEEEITPPATPFKTAVLPPAARPYAQRSLRLGPSVECARRTAAVLRLQAVARGWLARVELLWRLRRGILYGLVRATLRLQAAVRGLLARALARRSVLAAVVLQALVRGLLTRQGEPWLRASARAARRAHRLPAAATLLQAGPLLGRTARRCASSPTAVPS